MNHPILKNETNVGLLHKHKRRRGGINVEQNSLKREYAIAIRGNAVRKRQSFTKRSKARGSKNTFTAPTLDVSRRTIGNVQ